MGDSYLLSEGKQEGGPLFKPISSNLFMELLLSIEMRLRFEAKSISSVFIFFSNVMMMARQRLLDD